MLRRRGRSRGLENALQGYLTHRKTLTPRTLQRAYAQGPMEVLGGVPVSYGRGTPVTPRAFSRARSLRWRLRIVRTSAACFVS